MVFLWFSYGLPGRVCGMHKKCQKPTMTGDDFYPYNWLPGALHAPGNLWNLQIAPCQPPGRTYTTCCFTSQKTILVNWSNEFITNPLGVPEKVSMISNTTSTKWANIRRVCLSTHTLDANGWKLSVTKGILPSPMWNCSHVPWCHQLHSLLEHSPFSSMIFPAINTIIHHFMDDF